MDIAEAIAKAVKAVDARLALLGIALSCHIAAGEKHGLAVYHEIFADRGYDDRGQLIPRNQPGALIEDAETAARRVVDMIGEGNIICASGKRIKTPVHSVCIHSDSAHAVTTTQHVRAAIAKAGITLAPFSAARRDDMPK
jgi:5-oxoprolinase (ATP-hydrolysing) subunit A